MLIYDYPYSTYETFASGLPTKYWSLSNDFQFYKSGIEDTSGDTYFVATGTDEFDYAKLEIEVECLDGNISFYWVAIDELLNCNGNFYIDDLLVGSIGNSLEYFETYVEMGMHKFRWEWWQEPLQETSQAYLAIKNIQVPDINASVLTPNNIEATVSSIVKIGIWANLTADYFMYNETAASVSFDKNSMPSIALTAPVDLGSRQINVVTTFTLDTLVPSSDPYANLDQPVGFRLEINSNIVDYFSLYNLTQYYNSYQGCQYSYISDDLCLDLSKPLEIKLSFEYNGKETLKLFVFDIEINGGPVPVIELLPDTPIVSFPTRFECNIIDTSYSVSYVLNSIDAENCLNLIPYTTPIEVNDSMLIYLAIYKYSKMLYEFPTISMDSTGSIFVFPIVKKAPTIVLQVVNINSTNAVILETFPIKIPIALCSFIDGCIEFNTYDMQPIYAHAGDVITACLYKKAEDLENNGYNGYSDTIDLSTIEVLKVSYDSTQPSNTSIKKYKFALLREVQSYNVTILNNIESSYFYSPFHLTSRTNIDLVELGYSLDVEINGTKALSDPYIDSSCVVNIIVRDSLLQVIVSKTLIFTRVNFSKFIRFCSLKRLGTIIGITYIKVYTYSIARSYYYSTYKYLNSISNLETILKESDYSSYKQYITTNDIYSLFLDKDMLYPIPFSFDIQLAGSKFFGIPDINASVYMESKLFTEYKASNLLCQLTSEVAYSTLLHLVPSACLRLSIDTSNGKNSVIKQLWTNIPANGILYSNNSLVQLSTDGKNFSQTITITDSAFYVMAIAPSNFSYSSNILNITIDYISVEYLC